MSQISRQIAVTTTLALIAYAHLAVAQASREFRRTLPVSTAEAVTLDVEIANGELQILYGREGEVSIAVIPQSTDSASLGENRFVEGVTIEQVGSHLKVRSLSAPPVAAKLLYRIDVPYRTAVNSMVMRGKQAISGIMGPVHAEANKGDIKVSYVSKSVVLKAVAGNLDTLVIGERVVATTDEGDILCQRAAQGTDVETNRGDIALQVVGPSRAIVKNGNGRIDVEGVRGTLVASTDGGDIHVKAMPHDDWILKSRTGTILAELPTPANVDVDAATRSGTITINRDDLENPAHDVRQLHGKLNGGGKHLDMHTEGGKIVIR